MIGKIGIATVFSFSYLWCSEFYPSTLRSTLLGLSSLFARVGSILAPIIVDLVCKFLEKFKLNIANTLMSQHKLQ